MHQREIDSHIVAILKLIVGPAEETYAAQRARYARMIEHQRELMDTYGSLRGWQRASDRFSLRSLARVSSVGERWKRGYADHPSFWTIDGQPTAVVGHLYSCDDNLRQAVREWAARRGLRATFSPDFPSWHYPGRTTLVEIARAR